MQTAQELRLSPIPAELRARPNWVVWKYEPRGGKPTKVPYNPTNGNKAKAGQSSTWGSFDQALAAMEKQDYDGIGFEFDGDHFGIDIDHCIDLETGEIDPAASSIVEAIASYAELSPSGTGIHILCKGQLPTQGNRGKRKGPFEFYGQGRYFTMTGKPFGEVRPLIDGSEAIKPIMADMFKEPEKKQQKPPAPVPMLTHEIISKAMRSKNGEAFKALYEGDISSYASHSEADIALCDRLAFWFACDAERMDEAFRGSGLMRDKWDEKHGAQTYGDLTIQKAIASCGNTYDPERRKRAAKEHGIRFQAHIQGDSVPKDEPRDMFEEYARIYERSTGLYMSDHGETLAIDKDGGARPLANFTCVPTREITKDDGVEKAKEYVMEGINARGQQLPPIAVPAKSFAGMNWVTEGWGFAANIAAGSTMKDKLRHAITEVGARTARRETMFTHTGWREIDGRLVYLHEGGAIGAENVTVELQDGLKRYALEPADIPMIDCARASMELLSAFPARIAYPLLAFQYLAPLREFMKDTPPSFALALIGGSGTGKSTIASLFLSHYGKSFNAKTTPASFEATANALSAIAFYVKDAVLLVDDFHPVHDLRERKAMNDKANALSRGAGDGATRTRLTSEAKIRASKPPRALVMITGEDTPQLTESGTARYFNIEVHKGEIELGDILTGMQKQGRQGMFSGAMRGYIGWLAEQASTLPSKLTDAFERYRKQGRQELSQEHQRLVEAVAHLCVALEVLFSYWVEIGIISDAEAREALDAGFRAFCENTHTQGRDMKAADPVERFIAILKELEATGEVYIRPLAQEFPIVADGLIGYKDDQYYYLYPNAAYNAVNDALRNQSGGLPISGRGLAKLLAERGILATNHKGQNTRLKRVPGMGTAQSLWHLSADAFEPREGPDIATEENSAVYTEVITI